MTTKELDFTAPEPLIVMTSPDVARLFSTTTSTVQKWIKNGFLPKPMRVNKTGRYRFDAVAITEIFNKYKKGAFNEV